MLLTPRQNDHRLPLRARRGFSRGALLGALAAAALLLAGAGFAWKQATRVPLVPPPPPDEGQESALQRSYLEALVQRHPERWVSRVKLASLYSQGGDSQGAVDQLLEAAKRRPKDPQLLIALGEASEDAGRTDLALPVWNVLSRVLPRDPYPRARLSATFRRLGWTSQAWRAAKEAVRIAPHDPEALRAQAVAEYDLRSFPAARAACQKLLKVSPQHPIAASLLARIFREESDWVRAVLWARNAAAWAPEDLSYQADLASFLIEQPVHPEYEEAMAVLQRALRVDPGHLPSHYWLGCCYEKLGRLPNARQELEIVYSQNPSYLATGYRLSRIYSQLGMDAEARRTADEYRRAHSRLERLKEVETRLRTRQPTAAGHLERGRMALETGDAVRAVIEARQALALRPGDTEARALLAKAQQGLRR
jgi:tetratricopeptide (TPR) repeat protein